MSHYSDVLILWYNQHQRNLPWRQTNDPYLIWISEVILQQTQIITGLDYYLRITERYPSVVKLANASEDDVLKLWQGLGYYSRARNMLLTAKHIATDLNGVFPSSYNNILALKGIGPYTAAAIASFAFNLPHAVVDGNVSRVISRLFAVSDPIDSTPGKKKITQIANHILDLTHPATHNQAMMDIGALICKPSSPNCTECPFVSLCLAFQQKTIDQFPIKSKRTIIRHRYILYIYLKHSKSIFIEKRQENDIWKGLFQLPAIEMNDLITLPIAEKTLRDIASLTPEMYEITQFSEVKHQLTHQCLHLSFISLLLTNETDTPGYFNNYKPVNISDIHNFAFPKPITNYLTK